ncbi:hypothetical protein [Microbacterium sp. NPDC087589]
MGDPAEERLRDMASFVVSFHWRPADYYSMTLAEREAILTESRRQSKRN